MSKLKSDSKWNELTGEQRDTLEEWLFEENISYTEAFERVEKEFGIKTSRAGIGRFYQHLARQRLEAELSELKSVAAGYRENPPCVDDPCSMAMMLVTNRLFQLAANKPRNVKDLVSMTKVLLHHDALEVKRQQFDLQQSKQAHKLDLEREKKMETLRIRAEIHEMFGDPFKKKGSPGGGL